MSHRLIKNAVKDFVGKTIARVDARAVNVTTFYFTDGTSIIMEVEAVGPGIYGMVACDECAVPVPKRKSA